MSIEKNGKKVRAPRYLFKQQRQKEWKGKGGSTAGGVFWPVRRWGLKGFKQGVRRRSK